MPNIDDAWRWAVNTCNNPYVGYSQVYRNQQKVAGITYYDCSSFINYALLAGGFTTPNYAPNHNAFTTATMGGELQRLGFSVVSQSSFQVGDIGVSNNYNMAHTEMVYATQGSTAQWMGAHTNQYALPEQVSITPYWAGAWFDTLYRYGAGGTVVPDPDLPTYSVTMLEEGQIINGGVYVKSYTGNRGDTVTIYAPPYKDGYAFNHWELSGSGTILDERSNITRFTLTGTATLTPVYTTVRGDLDLKWWQYPLTQVYRNQYRYW